MSVVCIAGMHRSGTSLIARMLNLCGLYLGSEDDLLSAAPDNPEGFWENRQFLNINDNILFALNGNWAVPPTFEPGWEFSEILDDYYQDAERLIKEIDGHPTWG